MVRRKYIRSLAEKLLVNNGVRSAPVPLEKIAASLRVKVQKTAAEDDLSGFLYRDRKKKTAIIGVNASQHENRQNFTVAHELGHFLLHDFDDVHVDRQFKVWLRSDTSSQGTNFEEREANLFAAELLMPARFLERDVEEVGAFDVVTEDAIKTLADKYSVSPQAMTFRLAYLGVLEQ
jgi:Zn-dependent peptidase ImmA (M78 family)